jgi:iron complex outermembrane receptor protein
MSASRVVLGAVALTAVSLFGLQPAFSQVQVVTVTAQKKAENVQDVPMSISAYSGEFLEDKGVDAIIELNNYTPNFRVNTPGNPRNSSIKIRGVGSSSQNAGVEQSVGTFVDGVYVPRAGALLGEIVDIKTVEILRGPQGTLYGRNTSIGALNVNTRDASQDFEFQARGTLGKYDQRAFSTSVNGGLTDDLAVRMSAWFSDFAGYEKNIVTGAGMNDRENYGARMKFKWEPADSTDIQLIVDYQKQVTRCCTSEYTFVDAPMVAALTQAAIGTGVPLSTQLTPHASSTDRVVAQGGNQHNEDEQWGAAVIAEHELGGGFLDGHTIRSITSYRRWDNNGNFAQSETYLNFQSSNQTQVEKTFSQEINFLSPDGGIDFVAGTKLGYIGGAYFFRQRSHATTGTAFESAGIFLPGIRSLVQSSGLNTSPGAASCVTSFPGSAGCPFRPATGAVGNYITDVVGLADFNDWTQKVRSYAFFGNVTLWVIPEVWSMTGGFRYSRDDKVLNMDSTFLLGQRATGGAVGGNFNANFNNIDYTAFPQDSAITWLANTRYFITPDIMFYFTASTGYKSPGGSARPYRIAQAAAGQPVTFGPEDSINFEAGFKNTLFDNRLVLNFDVYRTVFNNFQQSVQDPTQGPGAFLVNFGKLRQQGIEAEVRAAPFDWLDLDGSMALLDSQWVDFTRGPCVTPGTFASPSPFATTSYNPGGQCNYNGHPSDFSPRWSAHMGGLATFPLMNTALEWFAGADWSYTGWFFSNEDLDRRTIIDRVTLFDAKLGVSGNDGQWKVTLWGRNLADKTYYSSRLAAAGAQFFAFGESRRAFYQPPRTIGITGDIRF